MVCFASYLTGLTALVAVIAPVFAAPVPERSLLKIRDFEGDDIVPDSYIVVYNDHVNTALHESHMLDVVLMLARRSLSGDIGAHYDMDTLNGYQVTADPTAIAEIAASPEVAYIEKDFYIYGAEFAAQSKAPYGLARISHRNQSSNTYLYDPSAGKGVTVYVLDSGICTEHSEFEDRASWGANLVPGSPNIDELGHGTHCAGIIGGRTVGVAKNANLVAVKVLDGLGRGTASSLISAMGWVQTNAVAPAVLSMSLGSARTSLALNAAVQDTVALGFPVIAAAGNSDTDAVFSPASEPSAITVGAIDIEDKRAPFSNYGSTIDVFAPGVHIPSAYHRHPSDYVMMSGTSQAAPHIAGLAAYLMALEGISGHEVQNRIKELATPGMIVDAKSDNNLIGYNGDGE